MEEQQSNAAVECRRGPRVRQNRRAQLMGQGGTRYTPDEERKRLSREVAHVGLGVGEERGVVGEGGRQLCKQVALQVLEQVRHRGKNIFKGGYVRRGRAAQKAGEGAEQRAKVGGVLLAQVDGEGGG
jgi:hypothetical protein